MAYISQYTSGLCLIEDDCSPFDLCAFNWYIGNVSERVAKKILTTHAKTPGSFLVLDCNGSDADYILLVNNGNLIFHHDVRVFPDNSCLVGGISFKNLSSAVYYYTRHKINGVLLYDPTMMELESEEFDDIGPPPRVIFEDEEITEAQNAKEHVLPSNSESNLDTNNGTRTQIQCEQNSTQKYPNTSSSGFDLGSLTSISGTRISPGFSSFETFKPKVAQNRKQRCDSPVHKPLEHKSNTDTQKSLPVSRLPKPKIYTTKTAPQIKPTLIRRSAQLNLSSLTSIKKDEVTTQEEVTKPKKVPPPVPPRRSSLCTISKTSLEEYADKLGSIEPQTKTENPKSFSAKSQANTKYSSTEPQVKNEIPKCSLKVPVNRSNIPKADHSPKDADKIRRSSKGENCNKSSIKRGHTVEKSARPRIISNLPLTNKPPNKKTQMPKHPSYESTKKNGQVIMTSANTELEKVYRKITKFNWNSTEFSNPSPLSSSSSSSHGSNNSDNVRVPDSISPHSSVISISSTCSAEYDVKQAHSITNSQMT